MPKDIKSVIALLCKHLHLSIDCTFKPEYFKLAKYNKTDENVTNAFWTILNVLSRQVVKDLRADVDFDRYADFYATKLYFALLGYSTIDFYLLSSKDYSQNRELLLAMSWLLAEKDSLNIAVRNKLRTSFSSQEYTLVKDFTEKISNNMPEDAKSQMNCIVHTCGRINHNIKEIDELTKEKIKLTTKIHGASLNASGLPHLSVSQLALTKKSSMKNQSNEEFYELEKILDIHRQWKKCQDVFYDWMLSVIEEKKNDKYEEFSNDRLDELTNFVSLLRHVTKKKLHLIKTNEITKKTEQVTTYDEYHCTRLIRTQSQSNEVDTWSKKTIERLNIIEDDIEIKMNDLTANLKIMLKSIPNCVEI